MARSGPLYASIAITDTADVVSAVTGGRIRVRSLFLVASGACTVVIKSGTGGTALTGTIKLQDSGGFILPESDGGWMITAASTALNITLSTPTTVGGCLVYEVES